MHKKYAKMRDRLQHTLRGFTPYDGPDPYRAGYGDNTVKAKLTKYQHLTELGSWFYVDHDKTTHEHRFYGAWCPTDATRVYLVVGRCALNGGQMEIGYGIVKMPADAEDRDFVAFMGLVVKGEMVLALCKQAYALLAR